MFGRRDDKKTPKWVRYFRERKDSFDVAGSILETLWQARGGGKVSTALAGVSTFGKVLDVLYPNPSPWRILRQMGLSYRHFAISSFIAKTLFIYTAPEQVVSKDDTKAYVWRAKDGEPAVGLIVGSGGSVDVFIGSKGEEFLRKSMQCVWEQGNELMITRTLSKEIIMTPLPELGPYIGKKSIDYYVKRLSRYGKGARTILLRGPTGVGKTVLGRHISIGLGRESARTLKISSEVLKKCDGDEILTLIQWLRPTVLLLDDLNLASPVYTESLLALLETLREPNTLVIVTMMTNGKAKEEAPKPGSWHFPGMRPGRIEEIFTLFLPDKDERKDILAWYFDEAGFKVKKKLLRKISAETEGLSGAYLSSVVERIITHGVDNWKEEVAYVMYAAPIGNDEEESPGEPGIAKKCSQEMDVV